MVIESHGESLSVWDPACGTCHACAGGWPDACATPLEPGAPEDPRWLRRPGGDASFLEAAAVTHDLVAQSPGRPAVLVIGADGAARASAVAAVGAGGWPVVVLGEVDPGDFAIATDERATRALLAVGPSGRADLVIAADGNLERAARIVRRGGAIAALGAASSRPSVTVMVQRELELRAVRDRVRSAVACRVDP